MPNIAYLDLKYDRRSTVTNLYDDPFTITALTNDCTINISNVSDDTDITFKISYDNGMTYEDVTIEAQDTLSVNISNAGNSFPLVKTESGHWMSNIRIDSDEGDEFSISGNIMTLMDADHTYTTVPGYYFYGLFNGADDLVDASELRLPATEVGESSYANMFDGCSNLKKGPVILPATTLDDYCYGYMFGGCTSLIAAPSLPATTLAEGCYNMMFWSCDSLMISPELPATTLAESCYHGMFGYSGLNSAPVLPATTLAYNCYEEMFIGCWSLVTAPALPATSLAEYCYKSMFEGCTSLTAAPNLIAENMVKDCYKKMFYNCENLNFIRILAKDTATDYITDWVHNVAPFGVFIKDPDTNYTIDSDSGVPIGWTVVDEGQNIPVTLNLSIDPEGAGTVEGGGYYSLGDNVTIEATPYYTHDFVGWYNYNNVLISEEAEYSFIISTDTYLTAKFVAKPVYTVTLSMDDPELQATLTGAGQYVDGTLVTVSASNITDLNFSGWKLYTGYISYNQTWQFVIHSDMSLKAVYEEINDYYHEYFTIEPTEDSCKIYFNTEYLRTNNSTIDIKVNSGSWNTYSFNDMIISHPPLNPDAVILTSFFELNEYGTQNELILNTGDRIQFRRLVKDIIITSSLLDCNFVSINPDKNYKVYGNIACLESRHDDTTNMTDTYYAGINLDTIYTNDDRRLNESYYRLFRPNYPVNRSYLIDVRHLILPFTTLGDHCYESMFESCTSLVNSPELPATILAPWCYGYMFHDCTSLTAVPNDYLPVTTLQHACYQGMFNGCTSLVNSPELPATILAPWCYAYMFHGCTSLTKAPALPATTLAEECYRSMFSGCTSLTEAPALPATEVPSGPILSAGYYSGMFAGCTSLTKAPALPLTTIHESCYYGMFNGCTSLTKAPVLPATTLASECYGHMFSGCTSLTEAPVLPATTLANDCYEGMFKECTSLTEAPVLPATTLARECYRDMFKDCTSLITSPFMLPASTLKYYCYAGMFSGCTSLINVPNLKATLLAESCYRDMFKGCTSLTEAPVLPITTLEDSCYYSMFNGCTSLTEAPALPATTLAERCYVNMFLGCTSLSKVTCLATSKYSNSTSAWLSNVAANGIFTKNASMNDWSTGWGGIPEGWAVQDYVE